MLEQLRRHAHGVLQAVHELLIACAVPHFEVETVSLPGIPRVPHLGYVESEFSAPEYLGGEAVSDCQGVGAVAVGY